MSWQSSSGLRSFVMWKTSTSSDEDFQENQNILPVIISSYKNKSKSVGTINEPQNNFLPFLPFYTYIPDIGLAVWLFANGPGDLGSIPGRVILKTQKMVLDVSLLNTQHYKVRIKGKVEKSREGVAPSPTPWCSSYRKGSLRVTLDYGRQLYFTLHTFCRIQLTSSSLCLSLIHTHTQTHTHTHIYIYIYIYSNR